MTGNIGKHGTGANSITGQCNAMGSRLFSNTTNLLGGHDFTNPVDRHKVADIMGLDVDKIPNQKSWAYDQIIDGIETGEIRGLWVVATNGAHSWVEQERFRKLMGKLEFLVVQDLYATTETAQLADLVLPAGGWGEKDGTLINSERRLGLVKKVSKAPGQALSDFSIFRLLATAWGSGEWLARWTTPEDAFHVMKELSQGQPCDISGIRDYRQIDKAGGIQWPWDQSDVEPATHRRLFEDGQYYTGDRRAKFIFDKVRSNPEPPDEDYPFQLLTGRGTSAQWHTQTRTAKSKVLRRLYPAKAYVEIHRDDANNLGIQDNQLVTLESRRGTMEATALISPTVQPGQLFVPMHYEATNRLTISVFDPQSRQPCYKACAVRILVDGR